MRRCFARHFARLGFQEVNAVWRGVLQDEHLRTVSRWRGLADEQVGVHLGGVASLAPWWDVVARACPLVASPVAERVICEVRAHLTRLLALSPAALPLDMRGPIMLLAKALSAQAQRSEHAYMIDEQEVSWAQLLPHRCAPEWRDVAEALLPAFPASPSCDEGSAAEPPTGPYAVQRFYEKHVFPQWEDLVPWDRPDVLAGPVRDAGKAGKSVLVAGCGTGRWACHFAASFPEASVLGVDVSRASLDFALGRKHRFGLRNVDFQHADLRSWSPARSFDFIECGGVLHHLEDPEATWARLASLLRPGGVMLVSLYSRAARRPLKQWRASLLPRALGRGAGGAGGAGFSGAPGPPDDEALRRFRHMLLGELWESPLLPLAQSPDFHSLSRLRDTFFHPLEHEYDLAEVEAMLGRLGLRALGFDADGGLLDLFRSAKPGADPADLRAWHELETQMPEIFLGMYEMFVARRR